MSLTRKPGKAAASSDVNPRKGGTASLKEEQVVSRRPTQDRREKLQQWRQNKLEERNKSAGKVMPTSSRPGKENNIKKVQRARAPAIPPPSSPAPPKAGASRPSGPAAVNEQVVSRRPTQDRREKLQQWRQKKLEERNKSAGKVMPTSSRRGKELLNAKKVQRAPAPASATPPPSSPAPAKAGASRLSGVSRPSATSWSVIPGEAREWGRATGRPSGDRTPRSTAVVGASCGPMGSLETTEIGAQTEAMPGVAHAVVQVGEGRLLTVDKLREKATIEELAERLRMASHDLEAEVFHREIVKQEQEQLRRKLVAQHEEEIERLRRIIKEKEAEHNNVMVRMRWERAKEAAHHEEEIERLRWTEKMKMRREHAEEKVQRAPAPATPPLPPRQSRKNAVNSPAGKGPFSENGIAPTLAVPGEPAVLSV
ncbi:unnamed protein product, partial [Ascophyllum nodosum]